MLALLLAILTTTPEPIEVGKLELNRYYDAETGKEILTQVLAWDHVRGDWHVQGWGLVKCKELEPHKRGDWWYARVGQTVVRSRWRIKTETIEDPELMDQEQFPKAWRRFK